MLERVQGFTLTELLVALAILGIVTTIAVPAMNGFVESSRVKGVAEVLSSELQLARSEAVKRNMPISLSFGAGSGSWCFGIDENPGCDCTLTDADAANACALPVGGTNVLKTTTSETYQKVTVEQTFAGNAATFDPVRGTVNSGDFIATSSTGKAVQVDVTVLGRVHICSDDVSGYQPC